MKTTDEKITETLNALSGIKKANAPDHFEVQLENRLRLVRQRHNWFQYSAAALVLFALLNLITALAISESYATTAYDDPMEESLFDEELYTLINLSEE